MTHDLDTIRKQILSVYAETVGQRAQCALLDFPDHSNVGDSLIWLGERAALRHIEADVRYGCSLMSYSTEILRRCLAPGGVVLLHGGGNFGTLWPFHHKFRLQILRSLKEYRIVQLPQSLFFDDDAVFEETRQAIAEHPDFTLLVRDQPSLQIARQLGAKASLCADSALCLRPELKFQPRVDCAVLARTDKESGFGALGDSFQHEPYSVDWFDWLGEPMTGAQRMVEYMRWFGFKKPVGSKPAFQKMELALFDKVATDRLLRGSELLGRGRVVVTDRLHAHILSMLLGIPNVVLDNSSGKVHGFMQSWTGGHPLCRQADSLDHARSLVQDLLKITETAGARAS